jgi:hypothetical protein
VNILSREKFRVLAEKNGWSLDHAKGFVDGEILRRRGKVPSKLALIGIDEYCLGFRAGYFERQHEGPTRSARPQGAGLVAGFAQSSG